MAESATLVVKKKGEKGEISSKSSITQLQKMRNEAEEKKLSTAARAEAMAALKMELTKTFESKLAAPDFDSLACARWMGLAAGGQSPPFSRSAPLAKVAAPYSQAPYALLLERTPPELQPSLTALVARASQRGEGARFFRRIALVAAALDRYDMIEKLPPASAAAASIVTDDDGATPLLVALRVGKVSFAEKLLSAAPAVASMRDAAGRCALHELAALEAAAALDMCERLLRAGCDAGADDESGATPLHVEASLGRPRMLGLLLQSSSANPLSMDDAGRTPLACALLSSSADAGLAAALLLQRKPVALAYPDGDGRLPMAIAADASLAICAALADACSQLSKAQLAIACKGCPLHALARVPTAGSTLAIALSSPGGGEMAKLRAGGGRLALHVAASEEAAEALIAALPSALWVNARDTSGRTSFWYACAADAVGVAKRLADAGAITVGAEAADSEEKQPFDVAGTECKKLLKEAFAAHEKQRAAMLARLRARAGAGAAAGRPPPDAAEVAGWEARSEAALVALQAEMAAFLAADAAAPAPEEKPLVASSQSASTADPISPSVDDEVVAGLAQLQSRRWQVQLAREARLSLFALSGALRLAALRELNLLANGDFRGAIYLKTPLGIVFKTDVSRHGGGGLRLVFELAPAFSAVDEEGRSIYTQALRVWGIIKHDKVTAVVDEIVAALSEGAKATRHVRLQLMGDTAPVSRDGRDDVHPRSYVAVEQLTGEKGEVRLFPAADMSVASELLPRVFTVANDDLGRAVASGAPADRSDWPLHVDQAEAALIELPFDSPVLLLGRSGTGKTTVAWLRMWRLYRTGVSRFVFITASRELRDRVRDLFNRQKRGAGIRVDDDEAALPSSIASAPASAWPLFLTNSDFLRLMDGACAKPKFERDFSGQLLRSHLAPQSWQPPGAAPLDSRMDIELDDFRRLYWPKLSVLLSKQSAVAREVGEAAAPAVWREFLTFIKGRAAAADMPSGRLSREAYVALPAKEAPTFAGEESRSLVYTLFERYVVLSAGRYDAADVVMSILLQQRAAPLGEGPHALAHVFVDEARPAVLCLRCVEHSTLAIRRCKTCSRRSCCCSAWRWPSPARSSSRATRRRPLHRVSASASRRVALSGNVTLSDFWPFRTSKASSTTRHGGEWASRSPACCAR